VARKTRVTIAWLMEGGRLAREWLMPVSRSEDTRLHPFSIHPPPNRTENVRGSGWLGWTV